MLAELVGHSEEASVKKLLVQRILLGLAVPVAVTGTRALATRAAARPGSAGYAPRLHQVADLLERTRGTTRRSHRRGR